MTRAEPNVAYFTPAKPGVGDYLPTRAQPDPDWASRMTSTLNAFFAVAGRGDMNVSNVALEIAHVIDADGAKASYWRNARDREQIGRMVDTLKHDLLPICMSQQSEHATRTLVNFWWCLRSLITTRDADHKGPLYPRPANG